MKRQLGQFFASGVVFFSILIPQVSAQTNCVSPPAGLVSWWKGEGNTLDQTETNNGTLVGNATFSAGQVGQAFSFDGSGNHVRVAASPTLDVGAGNGLTIEAWINPADLTTQGAILEWALNGAYAVHFYVNAPSSDGRLYADIVSVSGGDYVIQTAANVLNPNAYQHVALTYDKASGVARLFRNGVIAAESNFGTFTPRTGSDLYIGHRPASSLAGPLSFKGKMDEVSLYGRALSVGELQAIYNAGSAGKCTPTPPPTCAPAPAGLVSWWKAEGNTLDQSGTNNGTFVGNAAFSTGQVAQAFSFDGSGNHVRVAASPTLDVGAGNGLTIEAWINPADLTTQGAILEWALNGAYAVHFYVNAPSSDGRLYADIVSDSGGDYVIQTAANVLNPNAYQHVALTYDKASGVARLFRNGVIAAESNFGTFTPRTGSDLYIGYRPVGSPAGPLSFKGKMDEVSLYSRALSVGELQAIYNAGSAGKCTPTPPPTCAPAPAGLVSWWKGEGNLLDQSGTNNGTLVGNTTFAAGRVGQTFVFDGSADAVRVTSPVGLQLQTFTIEAWIKRNSATMVSFDHPPYSALFVWGAGGYGLGLQSDGRLYLTKVEAGSVGVDNLVTDTNWHHVAVTKSGSSVTFYVDGVAHLGPAYDAGFTFSTPVAIGAQADNLAASFYGSIDEVAVYNRPLAATEVQAIHSAGAYGKCLVSPPLILTHPANLSVNVGDSATFSVIASGTLPLSYQWRFNGTTIDGATSASLVLTNVQLTAAGAYSVAVSNLVGTATSSNAVLTVNSGGSHPLVQLINVNFGGHLTPEGISSNKVGVAAVGLTTNDVWNFYSRDIAVMQWRQNGALTNLQQADGSSTQTGLVLSNAPGAYFNRSSDPMYNSYLYPFSGNATVTITNLALGLYDVYLYASDGNYQLTVGSVDYGVKTSQDPSPAGPPVWQEGVQYVRYGNVGINNLGQTIKITVRPGVDGYSIISGLQMAQTSGTAGTSPSIVSQPASQTVTMGSTVVFTVTATGTAPLSYQWRFNGTNISGATAASLVLANVQSADAGVYSVVVSNLTGTATSSNAVLTVAPASSCAPLPTGLVSWWKGEGNTLDQTGTNNGTLVGNASFGAGPVGQAFVFDGITDAVRVSSPAGLQLQTFTIEAWIKRSSTSVSSLAHPLYAGLVCWGGGGYALGLRNDGQIYLSQVEVGAVGVSNAVTDTNWHHVAVTKTGSTVTFYVDGVAYAAPSYDPGFTFGTPVAIGAQGDNLVASFYGAIDEVAVYNRSLAATEIQAIYNAGSSGKCTTPPPSCAPPPSGLVSWWRAEGSAQDQAGSNNGTLAGNTAFGAGRVGQSFVFDGSGDGVSVGNPASLQLQTFTIEAWIKRSSATRASQESWDSGCVFCYAWGGYVLAMHDNGRLFFGKVGYSSVDSSLAITDTNAFHHVAVTKTGGTVVFYLDGVAETVGSYDPGFVFNGAAAIGARGDDFVASFLGLIDEVSVYNRALTTTEIQAIHSAGADGKCLASTPPAIVSHPANLNVKVGDSATFSVTASGTLPLSYQWRLNGTNLSGATAASLVLANVQSADAGVYSVVVSNMAGTVTSSNAVLTVSPPGPCAPAPSGLVSWWRAEGSAQDQAGSNNGTLAGNTAFGAGRVGQSFVFDGSGDGVSVGNPASLQLQTFTIEAWIKRSSATRASQESWDSGCIFCYAWGGYVLAMHDNGRLFFGKVGYSSVDSSLAITDTNTFHHVAVTKTGSTVVFYLDGVAETVGPFDPGFVFNGAAAIGARGDDLVASFLGLVDEVSVYNRALSTTEVQAIYHAGGSGKCIALLAPSITSQPQSQTVDIGVTATFNVVAGGTLPLNYQWRLNGTNISGATASSLVLANVQLADAGTYSVVVSNVAGTAISSNAVLTVNPPPPCATPPAGLVSWWRAEGSGLDAGSGNDGVLVGNAAYGLGRAGQGFVFDGSGDGVSVGNPPELQLQNFSIEAWIKRASATVVSADSPIYGNLFAYGWGGYALGLENDGRLYLSKAGVSNVGIPNAVADTNWHHLAVTKDGTNVVFYVDGVGQLAPGYDPGFTFSSSAAIGSQGDIFLASFYGAIDELSIYSRALSASEIQAIHNAKNSGKCVVPIAPFVISQPQNQLVAEGANVAFSVAAGGTPPLSYQWSLNGSPLANATNASLNLTGVTTNQAGTYAVLVTNLQGSALSSNATLSVRVLGPNLFDDFDPAIDTMQWAGFGGTVLANNYGGFVSASNSLWFGGSGSRYATTRPLNTSHGANLQFYLRLANGISAVWERPDLPAEGIVLEYTVNGGTNWTQIARYDTINYTNWTSVSIVIPPGAQATSTQFRWRQLANSGPSNDHWALDDVRVAIGPFAPTILAQPANQTVTVGGTATFSVTAAGTSPLSYQWRFNETNIIAGAPTSSLVLTNVQLAAAGSYSVVVSNLAGTVTSSNATLTVNLPPASVAVTSLSAAAGANVALPVVLTANGNENAAGFSLNFDPTRLSYTGVTLGSGAATATPLVNTNHIASGKLGIALALPTDAVFPGGSHEIFRVGFTTAIVTNATVATVSFGDVPINRQVSGTAGNALAATFASGTVSISAVNYEGDIAPRPAGDKIATITDWVLEGRYAARLDYPTNAAEFQRADCAPRTTLGDGAITVTDWVQAGRYAAALDPLTPVGGPSSEGGGPIGNGGVQAAGGDREVSVTNGMLLPSQTAAVGVQLKAQGNENALGFSLSFEPTKVAYANATLGSGAAGATLNVNASQAGSGKLGFVLALGTGSSFAAGTHEVVKLNFTSATTATCDAVITLIDQPVPRQVSDPAASSLAASYVSGTIAVNPLPVLAIGQANANVQLSWPLWASNFVLQTSGSLSSGGWTNLPVSVVTSNGQHEVNQSLGPGAAFYRLKQ